MKATMRLLCLSKRRPQGRDLFTQPYGRFYFLPRLLAQRGHEVHLLLLSYKNEPAEYRREANLHIHSVSALPSGPLPYFVKAKKLCATQRPDWVIGFSDIWYGLLAQRLGVAHGAKSLIDAYDNYESYIRWAKPLHWLWRHALAKADVVTAAGPQLAEWMRCTSGRDSAPVVQMAADPIFVPQPKSYCRELLGLPQDKTLLGYAGALHPNRGIKVLFQAFSRMREAHPSIELVLSGRLANGITFPAGVRWLGYRPAEQVPAILNAVDLLFVINKPDAFGNFSYPAKLYEAIACNVPVVATDVPGTAWILGNAEKYLSRPGDVEDLVTKANNLLNCERNHYFNSNTWEQSAQLLENVLIGR
jgi:glycosyltransferase involved in cell wall biosynthesis